MQSCQAILHQRVHQLTGGNPLPEVQALTDRQVATMDTLVDRMRCAKVDEHIIEHSISEMVSSYEVELIRVLDHLTATAQ